MAEQSVVGQMEDAQSQMEQWTHDTSAAVLKAIGSRPYGQEPVPQRQQAIQGATIYHDPQAWAAIIQSQGAKPALEYAQRLSRLKDRFPEEFAQGQMAAGAPPEGGAMNGPA